MKTISFSQFYENKIYLDRYQHGYVDLNNLSLIIARMNTIIRNIDTEIDTTTSTRYKDYLAAMKALAKRELELQIKLQTALTNFTANQINDKTYDTKHVLTKDLNLIPVVKLQNKTDPKIDYGLLLLDSHILQDYLNSKEKLQDLLQKEKKEAKIAEETKEDPEIINERRKAILTFEHPKYYVDEEYGYYRYLDDYCCECNNGQKCQSSEYGIHLRFSNKELKSVARSFALRSKIKKHFEDLNRVEPYDYPQMKQSRKPLHAELKALYRVFQRRMISAPMAVVVKLE